MSTRDWFSLKCPYCRHRVGVHTGPDAVASEPGTCHQSSSPNPDGTWTPCPCPGWWDDGRGTVIDHTTPRLPLEIPS